MPAASPWQQRDEIACRNDPRGVVAGEPEQNALVGGHKVSSLICFAQSKEKIVGGIARAANAWEIANDFCEGLQFVDRAASLVRFDEFRDSRFV